MTSPLRLLLVTALLALTTALQAGPPTFQITTQIQGDGEIVLDPTGPFKRNNVVSVTAIPGEGSVFDHWEGDLSGNANPTTIRVSGDHVISAVFEADGGGGEPGGGTGGGGTGGGIHPSPLPDTGMLVGYFTSWSVYRRAYYPGEIVASGAAQRLDVINYAFAGIDENHRCAILDSFADYGKAFDADETVDGTADTPSQQLKGNFNQLRKLKQMYPNLRVLISIGGWSESYRFSDLAASPANREIFIESCIDMFIRGHLPDGVQAAGVFDGIDIDWEYPARCGATCDFSEEDPGNFALLLEEFRAALDEEEARFTDPATGTHPDYLLTVAAPAGELYYEVFPSADIHESLDWINIMAYDFHGGWESSGPANHHAPLYRSPCDDETTADYGDKAVQAYLDAGVPGQKLLLGVPFYGRGWRGVAAVGNGLCQPARGIPRGTYEKGSDDYEVLAASGDTRFHEEDGWAAWTFDGNEFWSFDDPVSLGTKADYVNQEGLRGIMFWELSGDDPGAGLVKALRDGLTPP